MNFDPRFLCQRRSLIWEHIVDEIDFAGSQESRTSRVLGDRLEDDRLYRHRATPVIGVGFVGGMIVLDPLFEDVRAGSNGMLAEIVIPLLFDVSHRNDWLLQDTQHEHRIELRGDKAQCVIVNGLDVLEGNELALVGILRIVLNSGVCKFDGSCRQWLTVVKLDAPAELEFPRCRVQLSKGFRQRGTVSTVWTNRHEVIKWVQGKDAFVCG